MMYQLVNQNDGSFWNCGCATFFIDRHVGLSRLPIAVKCRIGSQDFTELALLDTAAQWSVFGKELVEILEEDLHSPTDTIKMSTRKGRIEGVLHRIEISLLAEQGCGRDLTIEGTVLVSKDWDGPTVLGYTGFLERIRFALDPGVLPDEQKFYFGAVE
jgi:hypothetical protein